MKLPERIERVFAHRVMPDVVVDMTSPFHIDSDVEEALWFTGRDWQSITRDDWQKHPVAFTFFSKEALGYYLPSILLLSLQSPQQALDPAESLIWELDRSPSTEGWTDNFANRFLGLTSTELDVLKEWLLQVCEYAPYKGWGIAASGPGDTFGRAFDTIDLLQKGSRAKAPGERITLIQDLWGRAKFSISRIEILNCTFDPNPL